MVSVPCTHRSLSSLTPLLQWHNLSREEQAKYYELARKERQLHSQLYPTWSARDNYVSAHSDPRAASAGGRGEKEVANMYGGLFRPGRNPYIP